ncbi:hypothetical protein GCM10010401_03590 [Rarobacter faecitabidus]|uniref:Glycosyltransferase involved in cell wall biosynthesis n=1 Tax=Rarobacter faecitabidus TaxID=13243 RepID=A0A542ZU51_RARFA|nr:glycosyltransferase family 4 protein [Rarobacter faecitabidus]TQL63885.1 hypothetical protein FB461_0364 [Rarobacter faecitabidus]
MTGIASRMWQASPRWARDVAGMLQARRVGDVVPEFPAVERREIRLLIAPANFAGQAAQWAGAVRRDPRVAAINMVTGTANLFGFPADYVVPNRISAHSRAWQRRFLDEASATFTHVLVEAELRPLGGAYRGSVVAQVRALMERGLKVAMVAHGTDVRLPSRHVRDEPDSPYAKDWPDVGLVEQGVLHNLAILRELSLPTFVSTPGLLADVPDATLLPLRVDAEVWRTAAVRPVLDAAVPRVVHVPSAGRVKGTHRIADAMASMHGNGEIHFSQVSGVAHARMPEYYGEADVVLDQFLIGDYGVAACEAMAAGRVVVGHVSADVRRYVEREFGMTLPIVEATVASLPDVLRDIKTNRDSYRDVAAAGPRYVERAHSSDASSSALMPWLTGLG